jgi:hypothetical protein
MHASECEKNNRQKQNVKSECLNSINEMCEFSFHIFQVKFWEITYSSTKFKHISIWHMFGEVVKKETQRKIWKSPTQEIKQISIRMKLSFDSSELPHYEQRF